MDWEALQAYTGVGWGGVGMYTRQQPVCTESCGSASFSIMQERQAAPTTPKKLRPGGVPTGTSCRLVFFCFRCTSLPCCASRWPVQRQIA